MEDVMRTVISLMLVAFLLSQAHSQSAFHVSNKTSGDTLLSINNDGNLGIRVPVPGARLDVGMNNAGFWQRGVRLLNPALENGNQLMLTIGRSDEVNNAGNLYFVYNDDASELNRLSLGLYAANDVLNILANERVGIRTVDPQTSLEVNGAVKISGTGDLPEQVNYGMVMAGYYNETDIGKIYVGDNSGWKFHFARRLGSTDTDLLTIVDYGNVGIGTTDPQEKLEVAGTIRSTSGGFMFPDGSVQASAAGSGSGNTLDEAYDQGGAGAGRTITADAGAVTIDGVDGFLSNGTFESGSIPAEGAGVRMMWYPRKGAFRAGQVLGTNWNDTQIGGNSTAIGYNNIASGLNSVALGGNNTASASVATALGGANTASGIASTALGNDTEASGAYSTAMGLSTTASGNYSTAMGQGIEASGENSIAVALQDQTGINVTQDSTMSIMGGRVGIGTISPNTRLEVADTIYSSVGGFKFPDGSVQVTAAGTGGVIAINDLSDGKTGGFSIFLGSGAGSNDDGSNNYNTGIGFYALGLTTSGYSNTATGYAALNQNSLGYANTANGFEALKNNTNGYQNTALGQRALFQNMEGNGNTALGYEALFSNTASYNTAIGFEALKDNSTGYGNTALGRGAMDGNTTGYLNTAIGNHALGSNSEGNANTATGHLALYDNNDGSANTATGNQALMRNTSGTSNTANGHGSLQANTSGRSNVAMGASTHFQNTIGNYNVCVGNVANFYNQEGSYNTIIGTEAGHGSDFHSKSGNVFIGFRAGYNEISDNKLYIENSTSSSPLIYGEFDNDIVTINGNLGVKTTSPSADIHIDGVDGALFSGTYGSGTIPNEGSGTRMMWYPRKAAFRSGYVNGTQWDDVNIGGYSQAIGVNTTASGYASTALGRDTEANATSSTAMGYLTTAGGLYSTAMGRNTTAGASYSTAIGSYVSTSGEGSLVIGDHSSGTDVYSNSVDNRFASRFAGGYYLFTNSSASIGAALAAGATSWSVISDSTKKENFKWVDGEKVLNKISAFNLTSWNYKGQDPAQFRHYGPMAQDFYAAFGHDGIGTVGNDTTIASADFDGVNFIAIQALEQRTSDLKAENKHLRSELDRLHAELEQLKAVILELAHSTQSNTGENKARTTGLLSPNNNHR